MIARLTQWFKREPKRIVAAAAFLSGVLALAIVVLISNLTTTQRDGTPEILLPAEPGISAEQPDGFGQPNVPGGTEELEFRIPTEEEVLAEANHNAADMGLIFVRTYLGYRYTETPQDRVKRLLPIVTNELLNELAVEIAARDWERIAANRENRYIEVRELEIIEYRGKYPHVVSVSFDVYDYIGEDYADTPSNSGIWRIYLEPHPYITEFTIYAAEPQ